MSSITPTNILKINSSGLQEGSYSRKLLDRLVAKLLTKNSQAKVVERDVAVGIEFIDEEWIQANFTPPEDRSAAQRQRLALSDQLVEELEAADTIVIAVPMYNFGIPAVLKAWIDQVVRARRTFKMSDTGVEGLLTGKRVFLITTSGGTEANSDADFATGYMRHILGFIGITDIQVIAADQLKMGEEAKLSSVHKIIDAV